jgi:N-acetylglucosamine kinase-like BadF-type ATPase
MRIECLFHRALGMLRKSASRIVARSIRVKKTLRHACVGWRIQGVLPVCALALQRALRLPGDLAYAFPMRYVLGFDGGGTKTDCVLMDESGAILTRSRSGPSNPARIVLGNAVASLKHAGEEALGAAGVERKRVAGVVAGLAGVGDFDVRTEMSSQLQLLFPAARVAVCTDMDLTMAAAGEVPLVVIIAGTGSAVIGVDASGKIERSGGHGILDGDPGSATAIGRDAIKRALHQRDRTRKDSELGKRILTGLQVSSWEQVRPRMRDSADDILTRVFPIVVDAAAAGDLEAREILHSATEFLSTLSEYVIDRLDLRSKRFRIVKAGGAMGRSEFFDGPLDQALHQLGPSAVIELLTAAPAETAARLAVGLIAVPRAAGSENDRG